MGLILWFERLQGQGMISFIHLGKNLKAAEFSCYEDVILDACCQNIASSDEIWHLVVEMSVLLVTCIHGSNPRSSWYASFVFCCFFLKSAMCFFQQCLVNSEMINEYLKYIRDDVMNGRCIIQIKNVYISQPKV